MTITDKQLIMLSDYHNASDPFLDRKEAKVEDNTIMVVSTAPVYCPDENQHYPEEVWQSLELWHMRHKIQVDQWLKADDLPF
jgi:hypothetical protein